MLIEPWRGWCSSEVSGPHGVWLWKHIRRSCNLDVSNICFIVGNGAKVKFGMMYGMEIDRAG